MSLVEWFRSVGLLIQAIFYCFGLNCLQTALWDSFIRNGQFNILLAFASVLSMLLHVFGFVDWETGTRDAIVTLFQLVNYKIDSKVKMKVKPKCCYIVFTLPDRCTKRRMWLHKAATTNLEKVAFPCGISISGKIGTQPTTRRTAGLIAHGVLIFVYCARAFRGWCANLQSRSADPLPVPSETQTLPKKPKLIFEKRFFRREPVKHTSFRERIRGLTISLRRVVSTQSL